MLAAIVSWFTPTLLFCLMNLVIAIIFLSNKKPDPDPPHPLTRPPSLLQRVRSINFNPYPDHDPTRNISRPVSLLERVRSINFSYQEETHQENDPIRILTRPPSLLERVRSIKLSPFNTQPETPTRFEQPGSETPTRFEEPESTFSLYRTESEPAELKTRRPDPSFEEAVAGRGRMRKSASVDMRPDAEETEEIQRPATVRERRTAAYGGDEEVDEKADDFINKFKAQLKLQRLDSILRYKEMLNRGTSR